jgi:hypothetical protein
MNSNNSSESLEEKLSLIDSLENNNSSLVTLLIQFELIEIYVVVIHFILGMIINLVLAISIILCSSHQYTHGRDRKMPVVDLILLIMAISTIARLITKTGLQVLCLYGIYSLFYFSLSSTVYKSNCLLYHF